ncbi:hypothetical protein CM19_07005 [Candidatus Acidianus copahuensis]|uniref:Urease accessory protein UreH-like transmembrane domain-containing protein n=1 Tax=Candidatus Acidianus copahuensis TaxID=1160895 RepID=A0A031LRN7_9CREN|nr:hypothetical protein [Candidatus Acidianus copahuensis]EZQ07084.1 hypothetical protein CM19_07005 [Candidatus Acidianus copahuensis]
MVVINLWNPQNVDFLSALVISYLLGILHGVTPDEHTWPITFSYSVGTFSGKGGAKTGLIFSSGFTLQRSILSELAYLALAGIFMTTAAFGITYIIVGLAMFLAAIYMIRTGTYFHVHALERKLGVMTGVHKKGSALQEEELSHKINPSGINEKDLTKPVPVKLALIHGFVAGFGFGAFALIIYTVLAPTMPNVYLGWVPGFLFGIGTLTAQVLFGTFFGKFMETRKHLTMKGIALVGKTITITILEYGGLAFILGGLGVLAFPQVLAYNIITPIKVHNLHSLGIGFFLVIITVIIFGIYGYYKGTKLAVKMGYVNERK